jgi:hypothetical protein
VRKRGRMPGFLFFKEFSIKNKLAMVDNEEGADCQ